MHIRLSAALLLLFLLPVDIVRAQHYEFFYNFWREGVGRSQKVRFERGMASLDIAAKELVLHKMAESISIPFKDLKFDADRSAWVGITQKFSRKTGEGTGWYIRMDRRHPDVVTAVESWFQTGDPRETVDSGYYKEPPLSALNTEFHSLLRKSPDIAPGTKGDILNDAFAFYKEILANKGSADYTTIRKRNDSLLITELDKTTVTDRLMYGLIIDSDSYRLVTDDKRNAVFFIATDPAAPGLRYDFVWGLNQHIDHGDFVLEMAQYRNDVFQKLVIFANERSDKENDANYVPYIAPVASACPVCKGKGYELSPGPCRHCKGSGHKKSYIYRAENQIVNTDIHNDGSRTITYLKSGADYSFYDCSFCKGTGRTLLPCSGGCKGTGKVMK